MFFENSTPLATQLEFDMDVEALVIFVSKDALEWLLLPKPR
jgi:hypothetical protein